MQLTSALPTGAPVTARLGAHHFAYLRAVAEGVALIAAARHYLHVEHGAQAPRLHRLIVEQARALARRQGDSRWRLIGLDLPQAGERPQAASTALPSPRSQPDIDTWAESQGLEGWSQAELQAMYTEAFGSDAPAPVAALAERITAQRVHRQRERNARLRLQRLQLLRELERSVAAPASRSDPIEAWLAPRQVAALRASGETTLGDLEARIQRGGRWWIGISAIGPTKAERLKSLLGRLLPTPVAPAFDLPAWPLEQAKAALLPGAGLSGQFGQNRHRSAACELQADDDLSAIRAWVVARAASPHTALHYEREAERFLLWCVLLRRKALSDATLQDCQAYIDFLADVPAQWISRLKVPRMSPGWAPFKGQLSAASRSQAVSVLSALCDWLVGARYLVVNPWGQVDRRALGAAPAAEPAPRAFTEAAWQALEQHLHTLPPSAAGARLRWICAFVHATGLRASELLRALRSDLRSIPSGYELHVVGKGGRHRVVPVPAHAVDATRVYFESRGLPWDTAAPATPLLGRLDGRDEPLSYPALYECFATFVRNALDASSLTSAERSRAARASARWLRHTYATRSAERQVPVGVLQHNLGHADPRSTATYYRAQRAAIEPPRMSPIPLAPTESAESA
ncbi:tyrosine-type recombinase/integrase [Aquincola sp. S2]|uniref:Tyrosine-type recombinase/integrase n=1 Tax=Pseudaquabacterium terrae TaxID=2732868 RepID=A0ABX2EUV9_9BURK|nr:tyrosine-type recombinase/integrase [Aquabacterium terrae]NRF72251.1 tyrosine-type recombinase/integrase [Aquabacterium terrae]